MTIPKKTLAKWQGLRSRGDNLEILKLMGKPDTSGNSSAISRAFKKGNCPDAMFTALNQFYTAKETRLFAIKSEDDAK